MDTNNSFVLFLGMVVVGVLLESFASQFHYFLTKKHFRKHHFSFGRYLFLLLLPLIATFIILNIEGLTILKAFLVFSLLGTATEWLVGFSYHMVVGQKLWTYTKYNITTYTSFLSIPIWGLAGVLFLLLAKAL